MIRLLGRRRAGLTAWAAAVALGVFSCDEAAPLAEPRKPFELAHLLGTSVDWKQAVATQELGAASSPALHLRVHHLDGELVTNAPVLLDDDYRLRFLPLVSGLPDECAIAVDALEGDNETELWRGVPHFTDGTASRGGGIHAPLEQTVRIPLNGLTGRNVRFRWRLLGPCVGRTAWIANPRLLLVREDGRDLPSILLVCSDQHRYDRAFGEGGKELMPALHEFAKGAVVYNRAYSNASWTLPSIVSTLTGLNPQFHRTGFRIESGRSALAKARQKLPPGQFFVGWGDDVHILSAYPRRLRTLGERLQQVGYDSAAVISNDFYVLSGLIADGFDRVIDTRAVPGDVVNQQVRELLEQRRRLDFSAPLLLLVHYMDVHEYLRGHVPAGRKALQKTLLDPVLVRRWYDDSVRTTDRNFAQLLSTWNRYVGEGAGLIAFYSDHGEHLQEPDHRHDRHGDSMDEVLLRVPLAIQYPKQFEVAPHEEGRPVSLVDLVPTLLAVAGAPTTDESLHGSSLLGLRDAPGTLNRAIFADYQLYGHELSSVRRGSHKLVIDVARGERLLVDVDRIANSETEAGARVKDPASERALLRAYDSYADEARNFAKGLESTHVIDSEEALERLRALGYVE